MQISHFFQLSLCLFLSPYFHMLVRAGSVSSSSDASALLGFKLEADLNNVLAFSNATSSAFCEWRGVQCLNSRAIKVVVESVKLGGVFAPDSLTQLVELRVLSLQNTSLTGRIPDLSTLRNLKVLFLSNNYFSGCIPPSVSTLHRLTTLDLSNNMLAGAILLSLNDLRRLRYLRLDFNRFNGSVPRFNQSGLQVFNVTHNDLTGAIPVTPALSRFDSSSFAFNPRLCGEIIRKRCRSNKPFFGTPKTEAAPPRTEAAALSQAAREALNRRGMHKHNRTALIIVYSLSAAAASIISFICFYIIKRKLRTSKSESTIVSLDTSVTGNADAVMRIEEENNELEEKVKRMQEGKQLMMGKSGSLVFCAGEEQVYTVEQLMRACAEMLGRGGMGTTYKAVLDGNLTVTVKRLDGRRFGGVSFEAFEGHMGSVGRLRHSNLVPLRAYFQAKQERLLLYDYQPNGSLLSLIHGSKPDKAKTLHWTSCLKIAEDIAQGLSYIHQAWRLVHGNLKASNVLLGSDFEACLSDYCLVALASPTSDEETESTFYKAPEIRKFNSQEASSKSDVYSFGILLLEILTGMHPSQHPNLTPVDMIDWMRSVRDEDGGESRAEMLLEVSIACSVASPDQRPRMWQVLKMIQEIKEVVFLEDTEFQPTLL